jgi:ATP-dependent protease ClpP protease subunit
MADFKSNLYLKQQFLTHFKRHSKMTDKQIEAVLFGSSDTWLSPTECKKFGLIDHVVDELPTFNLELPAVLPQLPPRGSGLKRQSRK